MVKSTKGIFQTGTVTEQKRTLGCILFKIIIETMDIGVHHPHSSIRNLDGTVKSVEYAHLNKLTHTRKNKNLFRKTKISTK